MADDHDDVLRRHRETFEAHKKWMESQQQLLGKMSPSAGLGVVAPPGGIDGRRSASPLQQQKSGKNAAGIAASKGGVTPSAAAAERTWSGHHVNNSRSMETGGAGAKVPFGDVYIGGGGASPVPMAPAFQLRSPNNKPSSAANIMFGEGTEQQATGRGGSSVPYNYNAPYVAGSPLTVHSRSSAWAKRKSQKLEDLRLQRENELLHECPFKPYTPNAATVGGSPLASARSVRGGGGLLMTSPDRGGSTARGNSSVHSGGGGSATAGASVREVAGVDDYIKRQNEANALREAKERAARKCDGSGWTNKSTVPDEFQFGRRPAEAITALKRPLRAPVTPMALDFFHGSMLSMRADRDEREKRDYFTRAAEDGTLSMPPRGTFSQQATVAIVDVNMATRNSS